MNLSGHQAHAMAEESGDFVYKPLNINLLTLIFCSEHYINLLLYRKLAYKLLTKKAYYILFYYKSLTF
ncbi:hypothetical protein C1N53_10100 [Pontibacter sp. SGAir0037]|nr:hypothetical protein C1N53_10100 [Pontibacter sp. SGAir0037]